MKTEFKSAEEWVKCIDKNPDYNNWRYDRPEFCFEIAQIQSNTMREAARIAVNRMSPMTIPDEFIDRVEKAILDAAIAIEKGEYKPI